MNAETRAEMKRDHDNAVVLAMEIEEEIDGMKATTVIFALCWVLASLILQGEHDKQIAPAKAIAMIGRQIRTCVQLLRNKLPSTDIH